MNKWRKHRQIIIIFQSFTFSEWQSKVWAQESDSSESLLTRPYNLLIFSYGKIPKSLNDSRYYFKLYKYIFCFSFLQVNNLINSYFFLILSYKGIFFYFKYEYLAVRRVYEPGANSSSLTHHTLLEVLLEFEDHLQLSLEVKILVERVEKKWTALYFTTRFLFLFYFSLLQLRVWVSYG